MLFRPFGAGFLLSAFPRLMPWALFLRRYAATKSLAIHCCHPEQARQFACERAAQSRDPQFFFAHPSNTAKGGAANTEPQIPRTLSPR